MATIRTYSTGVVDIFGELTVEDVKTIESKIYAQEIKIVNKTLNICFNNIHEISNTILRELIELLQRNPNLSKILIDLLQNSFVETIKLNKNGNGQITKHYKMHSTQHVTEFQACNRSNFYLGLLRGASIHFEGLIIPNDTDTLCFTENDSGILQLTKLRVLTLCLQPLCRLLKENTLTTLRKIRLATKVSDDFWTSLMNNTHVTTVQCLVAEYVFDLSQAFNDTMRHNKTLTTLALNVRWVGDSSEHTLFEGLRDNSTITSLRIDVMRAGSEFFDDLAEYLSTNASLTQFHLTLKSIKAVDAVKKLYDSLHASTIHRLVLALPEYDLEHLADFIIHNKTLLSLSIVNHSFAEESANLILHALQQNETICFWHHKLNSNYSDSLQQMTCEVNQVLRRNKKKREMYVNDMIVLFFNIARGSDALQLLPKELWLKIFDQISIVCFEYNLHDILATLFRDAQIRQVVFCPNGYKYRPTRGIKVFV